MAKTGITFNIQQELASITKNKSIIDWTYLSASDDVNFTEMVKHLYPWEESRAKLLNPWSYIWNIIWDKLKNFVWDAKTAFDINFDTIVESILIRGQIIIKYVNEWSKWGISSVRAETYWEDGWVEMIARVYPKYEWELLGLPTYYLYVQSYNGTTLRNNLYKVNTLDNLSDWEPVDLDKVYELSKLEPVQTIENLPRLAEVVDVIDRPMMDTVRSLIYSIDRKIAEAEKHFNDYSEQFKLFQNIEIPKNCYIKRDWSKVINWNKLWKIIRTQDYSAIWDIKIIKNWNELLESALKQADKQIQTISAITDIPLNYFGVETARDSWQWKEVGASNLFKRVQKYRDKIEYTLKKTFKFLSSFQKIDERIDWSAIIRMSENDVLVQQSTMLQNNMTSLVRAIMKTHNVDKAQADIIIEEVKLDQKNWLLVSLKAANQNADANSKQAAALK